MRIAVQSNTLWVNKRGERYVEEDAPAPHESVNAVLQQPDCISFSLLDEKLKQKIISSGKAEIRGYRPRIMKSSTTGESVGEILQSAAGRGNVCKMANSWDEIADWIGANPAVLKSTIEEYNSFCDKGHDDLFTKDPSDLFALRTPPYYAIKCVVRFLNTVGGIKINHLMEVVDHEDEPILGLYAAGIDTGGWESETYNVFLAGHQLGFALGSGRIAGDNAAKYVQGK
jgi:fumarate reductase flavoprotein subunit